MHGGVPRPRLPLSRRRPAMLHPTERIPLRPGAARRIGTLAGALAGVLALLGSAPPELRAQEAEGRSRPLSVYDAAWMQGCWLSDTGSGRDQEMWMGPAGGQMQGMARSVRNDQVVSFELMTLTEREEDGAVVLTARPSGQNPTDFVAVTLVPNGLRVENRDHDFPQAIEYLRTGRNELVARVFGGADDEEPAFVIQYRRADC